MLMLIQASVKDRSEQIKKLKNWLLKPAAAADAHSNLLPPPCSRCQSAPASELMPFDASFREDGSRHVRATGPSNRTGQVWGSHTHSNRGPQ